MTFEQMERTIQFILENQAESVTRNAVIEENFKRLETKMETLVEVTRDLVSVAEIHSRRLDRIEGIGPA